jgi:hypothetical protein
VTWHSDHRMADDAMIDETLPDEPIPAEPMQGERLSAEPLPGELLPPEPLAPEPLPGEPLPAEVITDDPMTDEPMTGATAMESDDPDLVIMDSGTDFSNGADPSDGPASNGTVSNGTVSNGTVSNGTDASGGNVAPGLTASSGLSEQWHDIQAMFVDDPQGSVERAAQEAEAAVSALVESLRQRQAALVPAGTSTTPSDTEQLRAALRGYRLFCERLAGLEEQLPRSEAIAL